MVFLTWVLLRQCANTKVSSKKEKENRDRPSKLPVKLFDLSCNKYESNILYHVYIFSLIYR